MNALVIDAFEFCRRKDSAKGETTVAQLGRLTQECVDASGTLNWSLQGGSDKLGHPQLTLMVSGPIQLLCQRCLTPFQFSLATESILILAQDEDSADEIEILLNDDSVDVITGSVKMDVMALVEDDALLGLPFAPRHEICPDPATVERMDSAKRPSPFSLLKELKRQ